MDKIDALYQSKKTVFSIHDIRLLWQSSSPSTLKSQIHYYVKTKRLFRLHQGVYTLSQDYDPREVAQKLITPSYISLETALLQHGVIFQYTSYITSIANYPRELKVDSTTYEYHSMKSEIVVNPLGIEKINNYNIASKERAIADWIYLRGDSYFDNLHSIDRVKLKEISTLYDQKSTERIITELLNDL